MKDFENKKFIITGAGGGIGSAIAKELSGQGATIISVYSKKNKVKTSLGNFQINLEKEAEIKQFYNKIKRKYKTIDWLINSAGWIAKKEDSSYQTIAKTFEVNLFAPIYLTNLFEQIINLDGGVINISSSAALNPNPVFPLYSASKAALNAFSVSLSKKFEESEESKKRSIALCPGPTNTKMRQRVAGDAQLHQSPDVIGKFTQQIITNEKKYSNGSIVLIRDNKLKFIKFI